MNWRLILSLGLTFGLLLGLCVAITGPAWLMLAVRCIVFLVPGFILAGHTRWPFAHGFHTGVLIGLIDVAVVLALWKQFEFNNIEVLYLWPQISHGLLALKPALLLAALPIALVFGMLTAAVSWSFAQFIGEQADVDSGLGK